MLTQSFPYLELATEHVGNARVPWLEVVGRQFERNEFDVSVKTLVESRKREHVLASHEEFVSEVGIVDVGEFDIEITDYTSNDYMDTFIEQFEASALKKKTERQAKKGLEKLIKED